ncbi:Aminoacyl-tRNA synthetase [Aspergillus avenaceus]|uniref:tyrosine--tRNA ligase n=1 Tax=Aspergillus avenaceus TaxID=36643 RepID=A0A5N6U6S3_ASPAV|nr:Aminoacyl-tRNA synthetase [Aspergillus avenaceus]
MATSLGVEQRYSLITRRLELQNGWSAQELQKRLHEGRDIKYHWVTAPTGKPHIGYFIPLIKFADFIRAGGQVTVEFIDVYAFLVNYKFPWDQVQHRTTYYRSLITAALTAVGVPLSKVPMAQMSHYQTNPQFNVDFWKMCALCSQQDCRDTGAEVSGSSMLSPLLTPILQELGEEYLDVDVQVGGLDQRGIFNMGEQFLPQLGYEKRVHLMNEMLPSLTGGKMSSSHPAHTKIMFLDDPDTVRDKIAGALCQAGNIEQNGILPILKHILFPVSELRSVHLQEVEGKKTDGTNGINGVGHGSKRPFAAEGAPEGTLFSVAAPTSECNSNAYIHYQTYEALEQDFLQQRMTSEVLKDAVTAALNDVLTPIREVYANHQEWQDSDRLGYPEDWLAV